MRYIVQSQIPTKLIGLRGTCGRYGIVLATPGVGPPAVFFIGLAPNASDFFDNISELITFQANFHFTRGGFEFPPFWGPGSAGLIRGETMVLSPYCDDLYAIAVPTAPGGDIYIDVTVFECYKRRGRSGVLGYQL